VFGGQVPGQSGAVGPGALHPDLDQLTEGGQPGQQRPVAGAGRGELGVSEQSPGAVERRRVMGSAMGVHATEDSYARACHHGTAVSRLHR
jgi:hypothetical protein